MEATFKDWLGSFWKIIVHPSESTFVREAQKAKGKISSAIGWLLFLAVLIHLYIYAVFKYVFPIHVIILTFILIPLFSFFLAFCLDTIYRKIFHRKKTYYDEFLYIGIVILIVSQFVFSILNLIPAIRGNYLLWASYLYPIVLLIIAVKSLTKLKGWQAAITVILSVLLALAGFLCMPTFLFNLIRAVPGVI